MQINWYGYTDTNKLIRPDGWTDGIVILDITYWIHNYYTEHYNIPIFSG